jgi:NTP pyrophosphatase (non-canonical NTP hydrolase)
MPVARIAILNLVNTDPDTMRAALCGGNTKECSDLKVVQLATYQGLLASYLQDEGWNRQRLRNLYGFVTGWLMFVDYKNIPDAIHAERERQEQKFRDGIFTFTCASLTASPKRKLRVLIEEIGEVARAIDRIESYQILKISKKDAEAHLCEELVQVAAVCVAWLESLEAGK